jgi:DnaJ-class molecular chaperone
MVGNKIIKVKCEQCGGRGFNNMKGIAPRRCPYCRGTGHIDLIEGFDIPKREPWWKFWKK